MRVGVIQSNYIPWRGYFDFIASVDLFIFYDDVQFSKNDWRNRNKVKSRQGVHWITVPVKHEGHLRLIQETRIEYNINWIAGHGDILSNAYSEAPFFRELMNIWTPVVASKPESISQLNVALIRRICEYLEIKTPLRMSSEFVLSGKRGDRLLDLLTKVGADVYVSGASAKSYLDKRMFNDRGIGLEYKSYQYPAYPQPTKFDGAVTVLDLIANCGPESRNYLFSIEPNEIV